jgi:hypothetical protein
MRKEWMLMLAAVVVLGACQKRAEAPPSVEASTAPAVTEAAPVAEPAAPAAETVAPAAEAAAPVAAGSFGVPECDDYVTKYLTCIDTKVPEGVREQIRASFDATRASWQAAAATEAGKSSLAAGCTQATEAARTAMAAYGCTF